MNDVHRRPFKIFLEASVFEKLFCSRYGLSESRFTPMQVSVFSNAGQDISDFKLLNLGLKTTSWLQNYTP